MKINIDAILNTALGLLLAGGIGLVGFLIANRLLGIYAYPALSPKEVEAVANQYERRYRIVTRACDSTHCRGVYDVGGSLYYYNYEFGRSFSIYPLFYERYSTDISLGDKPPLTFPE